ncbi:Bpu10I family restriction endonuclease [Anaerotruncus sp. 1XD22-93]|nr:Bpu10I family restriction endonuclease [Lachnospiraceae bacterium]NBI74086.1 Bpu10I family restriction endonuclease [Lachnospiraceae bacterium]RKK00205.1 Bpu10I family restriction endonuclease [Anaerotruncus sp. 1XD22-93]
MNYDEMITTVNDLNITQGLPREAVPHGNNLVHQFRKRQIDRMDMYEEILALYLDIRQIPFEETDVASYIGLIVERVNQYMDYFWPPANNPFSHQADFTSSIIPEMLCLIFNHVIQSTGLNLEVSAQKDLTIECIFDIVGGGEMRFKNKRVDVAVVEPCKLSLNEQTTEFPIPLLAIECKTNLDKNMLSGIEHSVAEMKKTFPNCQYFVITECSDFNVKKSNYASSGIDEIYILRKQKRGVIRRAPDLRNPIDVSLICEITEALIDNINAVCSINDDLLTRMQNGKLIGRI